LVVLVSVCAGVGAVFESVVAAQRALGRGKAGGGPGEPGNRAVGGFRVPPVLAASASRRCGAVCAAARAVSSVIWAAGSVVVCRGGRNGGLGENLEPGDLGCSGGSGFPPSAFPDWSSLLAVYSRSRDVVFPTSPSACWGGEVRNTEAARCERVSAGSRGDRDGNAAHSARTRGRCACADNARGMLAGCVERTHRTFATRQ
jgi:hypothetical protein